ncbi:TPA: hypothetical protein O7M57_003936 [Escherichia coli]|nr:hypothetical protein [Escherichia coli]
MTTITRESSKIKSFITGFLSDPAHDNQSSSSLLANVFRIALASLEAEPVAWQVTITKDGQESASIIYRDCAEKDTWVRIHETLGSVVHVTPLYMAPPAPVLPHEWRLSNAQAFIERYSPPSVEEAALFAWNSCRAAMLKGDK